MPVLNSIALKDKILSYLNSDNLSALADAIDRSQVGQAVPSTALMPFVLKGAAKSSNLIRSKLIQKAIEAFNKTHMAKVAEEIPIMRMQTETGEQLASHPARGGIFVDILENAASRSPSQYKAGGSASTISEGGTNLILGNIKPENPLMISSKGGDLTETAIEKLLGKEASELADISIPYSSKNLMVNTVTNILKKFKFTPKEIDTFITHNAVETNTNVSYLLKDAIASKYAKQAGFDAILPLTKTRFEPSEGFLLK